MQCFPLFSILIALGNPIIDYFSLDVEGSELAILKTIPFDQIQIHVMTIEVNHFPPDQQQEIKNIMENNGYELVQTIKNQDYLFKKRYWWLMNYLKL